MTLDIFLHELLRAALTLSAGLLVARVGLSYFFRQKEYETVKQRYLEQSVDVIAAEIESVSRIFGHNWARALEVLRLYRELPDEFDLAELKSGFLDLRATNFQRIAHHRLGNLIRSNVVWDVFQLALSSHNSMNSKATTELTQGIRLHKAGKLNATHQEFIERSTELLRPLSDESDSFASLVLTLQVIATELEQSQLRFKDVASFHEREAVVNAIEQLKKKFADDLR